MELLFLKTLLCLSALVSVSLAQTSNQYTQPFNSASAGQNSAQAKPYSGSNTYSGSIQSNGISSPSIVNQYYGQLSSRNTQNTRVQASPQTRQTSTSLYSNPLLRGLTASRAASSGATNVGASVSRQGGSRRRSNVGTSTYPGEELFYGPYTNPLYPGNQYYPGQHYPPGQYYDNKGYYPDYPDYYNNGYDGYDYGSWSSWSGYYDDDEDDYNPYDPNYYPGFFPGLNPFLPVQPRPLPETYARKPNIRATFTIVADGYTNEDIEDIYTDESRFREVQQCLGRSRAQIIKRGEDFVEYLDDRFGIELDFDNDDDKEDFIFGEESFEGPDDDGDGEPDWVASAVATPATFNLRLVSETRDGHTREGSYYSVPVGEAGWSVYFTTDVDAGGDFDETIPAGFEISFGDYCIDRTLQKGGYTDIRYLHYRTDNPLAVFSQYTFDDPDFDEDEQPYTGATFRKFIFHPALGECSEMGAIILSDYADDYDFVVDDRRVITCPNPKKYYD